MKNWLLTVFILVVCFSTSFSQPNVRQKERVRERIHAAKMAYITDRLQLTEKQSGDFIPVYNEMEKEIQALRKEFKAKYKGIYPEEADDTVSRQYIDDDLDYQEKVIGVRRKYNERFLKCISAQQLTELPKSEREFNRMILNRQREQHIDGRGGGWNRRVLGRGY